MLPGLMFRATWACAPGAKRAKVEDTQGTKNKAQKGGGGSSSKRVKRTIGICCDSCDVWYTIAAEGAPGADEDWTCGVCLGTHTRG